ncbi:hypothetical protein [Arthrobacter sp. M4]|uniref:hypothetical protein n=1 Tax=Arthrobacter sp. M4 TaxID=218160 RepID=UPI001CDC22FB|nr:hypothetical protein [Arthrobacter sp. M4]MCA4133733.1 hypothetical protein [Arthrobacter sp. M4]
MSTPNEPREPRDSRDDAKEPNDPDNVADTGQYSTGPYSTGEYGPPGPYGRPYGAPYPAPRKSRKGLWIALGIVGGVVVLAVIGVLVLVGLIGNSTGKARQTADDFTNLLIKGRTDEAYDKYLDPALMENLSREDFNSGIASLALDDSCKANYGIINVSSQNGNNAADVAGDLNCSGKTIDLAYRFEGRDQLKMMSIRLRPKA